MKLIKCTTLITLIAFISSYTTHTMLAPEEQQRLEWLWAVQRATWRSCMGDSTQLITLLEHVNTFQWINSTNRNGNSPLTQLLADLLQTPPNPNAVLGEYESGNWEPNTAECVKTIHLLIDYGANPEQPNNQNQTPLQLAEKIHSPSIINAIKTARTRQLTNKVGAQALFLMQFKNRLTNPEDTQ